MKVLNVQYYRNHKLRCILNNTGEIIVGYECPCCRGWGYVPKRVSGNSSNKCTLCKKEEDYKIHMIQLDDPRVIDIIVLKGCRCEDYS